MKRIISLILTVIMLACFLPLTAGAQEYMGVVSDEGRLPFKDVRADAWYADEAEFCFVNGIIKGMTETEFAPNGKLTRAQFVTMLANLEGVNTSSYSVECFTDVKTNHWYYGAVAWAYENEIVAGTAEDKFSPNLEINRETLSRMLCLYMLKKGYKLEIAEDILEGFADKSDISQWALEGVQYLITAGLMSGMTETTVAPKATVTRAQAARFLTVYVMSYKNGGHEHSFVYTDCVTNKTCSKCGLFGGIPQGHILDRYDCITGGFCKRCSQKVEESKKIHMYTPASCSTPEMCKLCGITGSPALGHTTKFGICSRCNTEIFASVFDRISYYMATEGIGDGNGVYNYAVLSQLEGAILWYDQILYDANIREFKLKFTCIWQTKGSYLTTEISIPGNASVYSFCTEYYESNGLVCSGKGSVAPADVKTGASVQLESYSGNAEYRTDFEKLSSDSIVDCAQNANTLLYALCGEGVDDFGFVNIK